MKLFFFLFIIIINCEKSSELTEYYPPRVTYYYDTVSIVQYSGVFHDKPRFRLKHSNNTYVTLPASIIINVGDVVETVKTDYYTKNPRSLHIYFDSHIKGTDINVIRKD
jgi:hypothetical protein